MDDSAFNVSIFTAPTSVSSNYSGTAGDAGFSGGSDSNLQSNLGIGLGFSYLPLGSVGFTTSLNYFELTQQGHGDNPNYHSDGMRLDANMAYTFNRYFSVKAGLNGTKMVSNNTSGSFGQMDGPGLGYQALLGIRFNRYVGIDAGYMVMNITGNASSAGGDNYPAVSVSGTDTFSGPFVALIGSF